MVKVLEPNQVDEVNEQVDAVLTLDEERIAARLGHYDQSQAAPDLSDGGMVGGVRVRPNRDKNITQGRPAARRAWMWNGTESLLPLAWNPDGTVHDGGRRYLTKRHCICCHSGGFRGVFCPNCRKNNCDKCRGSNVAKNIIPNFYLRKEDVPFPTRFFGSINCFLDMCPRRDSKGFLTEQDMRVHARSRHRMEYQAYTETIAEKRRDDMDVLKQQVADLLAERRSNGNTVAQERTPAQERMAKVRAAKKHKVAVGVA